MSDPKAQLSALQNDPDAAIEALNERYALCVLGGKPAVLVEKDDGVTFWSQAAFFAMLAGTAVYNGEKNVNLARWWWRHPGARRYEDVTFDPAGATEGTFNLWRGFSVGPRAGDCGRFLDHIHQVVCAADDDLYAWVMGWFAQIVQEPSTKIGTAVAFRGPPGSGKTIVGEMIGSLFVKNYMLVDNPSLVAGRFNGHLANLLLLHCDESFFAGDKAAAGRLRTIITAPVIPVEFKGREPISIKSCVRVLVTSEHGWIVPASVGERRFAVLDVSSARIGDHAYFRALAGTDRAALLHHLLNIDLEDVNLRRIPQTAGLIDQKIETAGALTKFWRDCLDRGHVLDTEKGWPEKVETDRLYEAYIAYAKDMGERYRRSAESFGKELKTMCPAAEKRRLREGGDRRYFYTLPGLEEARAAMAKYIGCP